MVLLSGIHSVLIFQYILSGQHEYFVYVGGTKAQQLS